MEFKKILVPVDGSETAEKAFKVLVLIWQSSTMRNSSFST